jgi:hypothetical protein
VTLIVVVATVVVVVVVAVVVAVVAGSSAAGSERVPGVAVGPEVLLDCHLTRLLIMVPTP